MQNILFINILRIIYFYLYNVQYMLVNPALLHKTMHYYSVHFLSLPYSDDLHFMELASDA